MKYLSKLFGNINENESQNLHEYLINFIAIDDFLPNGGLPIICILLYLFISSLKLNFKKF